jgi:hypothetical protein
MNTTLITTLRALIDYLIEENKRELLDLLRDWLHYHNRNVEPVIKYILENSDKLTDDFFDELIKLLDEYNETEFALLCVRRIIEREKKERFTL